MNIFMWFIIVSLSFSLGFFCGCVWHGLPWEEKSVSINEIKQMFIDSDDGIVWVDLDNGGRFYRWDGNEWVGMHGKEGIGI